MEEAQTSLLALVSDICETMIMEIEEIVKLVPQDWFLICVPRSDHDSLLKVINIEGPVLCVSSCFAFWVPEALSIAIMG